MKIISIEIKNFLAFKNSQKIEFKDGLNLFNGNIGSGKSSLYNAFYWCLYDKIYITDEGWVKKPQRENLLNFSELYNLKKDKSIECYVKIVVENNSEDLKNYTESVDGIFEINRSFEIVKRNESDFEKNKDELEIYYTNRSGADFLDETAIEDFLPEALSEYVWFQGESIDKLLDLDHSN